MNLFYTPDIMPPKYILGEDESRHCSRVLRLGSMDTVHLTDGRGNLYTAVITSASSKRCEVEITECISGWRARDYCLTMAVAPTKNIERFEWFLEKATEIGCDEFIPLLCDHSERRVIKPERLERIITGAMKQSLQAFHPQLSEMVSAKEFIARPIDGVKLIAHCGRAVSEFKYIKDYVSKGRNVLILIGPEGDFSQEEINFAVANGFAEITLGPNRLRTETAALSAVMSVAHINQ